ncbi:1-phosphofructokinase [Paenibacillus beijingensis]|uniref:Tagatose-6-phosphate kinase n=1 Tax=Paenibacillus beijingensis TaxID=1126833 RepID=A0A0D5NGP7_9BACL|nr:1-phosphofructokinase [Paenibacillus beijingensis]AJY74112.1 phosphofructokinase [Paenibacillus beijingensis]
MKDAIITVSMNPALDKTVTVNGFTVAGLNRIKDVRVDAGGKGINVAKVLKRFNANVTAWGIQAGEEGRLLARMVEQQGIPTFFLEAEGRTRTNLKVVDEATKETTELNEPGAVITEKVLTDFLDRFEKAMPATAVLVLGGSLPPGAPQDLYRQMICIASRYGVKTILDADGEALKFGITAAPYALKPNIHELEALIGYELESDQEIVKAAKGLLGDGIQYVIVSMGAEGSIVVSGEEAIRARPFPIVPLSTVGAGDSMVAALAFCLIEGKTLEETARWTTAAGSITASKPGSDVCTFFEVEEKLALVSITPISKFNTSV